MLDIKNRPRDSSKTDKLESHNTQSSADSPRESRSSLVIVIGVVALTSMIFGFILGRLI